MGYYTTQKAEIKAQLEAVSGIGKVYDTVKYAADLETFKTLFISNSKINAVMFTRMGGEELENGVGVLDEAEALQWVEKNDTWEITLHYGYHDEDTTPSDIAFNNLVDAIETKFRFLAGLNDAA
jgi:hypothetical protein